MNKLLLQFILLSFGIAISASLIWLVLIFALFVTGMYLNVYLNPLTVIIAFFAYAFVVPGCVVLDILHFGRECMVNADCNMLCPGVGAMLYFWIGTLIYILINRHAEK